MGVQGDAKINLGRKSGRGSVANSKRLEGLGGTSRGERADWGNAKAVWIGQLITRVTNMGGAVTLGLSRDKGAHMLTILLDGERAVLWFNGDADLDMELEKVLAYLDTLDEPETP